MSKNTPAYHFLSALQLAPPMPETSGRTLTGVAYSGGIITDHPHFDRIAFDLASTTVNTPIPLLFCHDHDEAVGVITTAVIDTAIRIESNLFTGIDETADEIANKADAGMPWQLSVGIWPGEITEIKAGTSINLNGATVTGPLIIFKNNTIREISVVTLGADSNTNANVFTATLPEDNNMPDQNTDNSAALAQLEAENATLKVANAELTQKINEFSAQQKTAKVKALFLTLGRDYTDDAAQPYLDLTDTQFSAIEKDLIANKPNQAPSYLFSAQAQTGAETSQDSAAKRLFNQVAGVK